MKTLPSKELISEVLKIELACKEYIANEIVRFDTKANEVVYFTKTMRWGDVAKRINIYELAHKCKEWALSEGYIIEVGVHPTIKKDRSDRDYFYKITTDRGQRIIPKFVEIIKTEQEAIFKACEWILKEMR